MFNFLFFSNKGFFIFLLSFLSICFFSFCQCVFFLFDWHSVFQSVFLSTWSVFLTKVSLFAFLSLCLFVFLSIYLFAFLLICLSINWSFFFPSVCLYASCSLINQTRVCFSKITKSPTRHWVKGKKGRKEEREKRKENRKVKTEEQRLKHPRELW